MRQITRRKIDAARLARKPLLPEEQTVLLVGQDYLDVMRFEDPRTVDRLREAWNQHREELRELSQARWGRLPWAHYAYDLQDLAGWEEGVEARTWAPPAGEALAPEYYFDRSAADRAIGFCQDLLLHGEGEWSGKPLMLEPWQREIVARTFGIKKRSDGTRRYRTVFVEVPRKNGKSTLASAIALYLLVADREEGGQVYSAAKDRSQAGVVFRAAQAMIATSPLLAKYCHTFRNSIAVDLTNSRYHVLSADAGKQHGLNSSGVVFDELHAMRNRQLWDVLRTSVSSRRQPLVFIITMSGSDRTSICWEVHNKAVAVLKGEDPDETFLPILYGASPEDDWTAEATWRKANPNLGVSKKLEYMQQECENAQRAPANENIFRQFELCTWTGQSVRGLFPMDKFRACPAPVMPPEGTECYGGLDLALTSDFCALALIFPRKVGPIQYDVFLKYWIPAAAVEAHTQRGRPIYATWAKQGKILVTGADTTPLGNATDYREVYRFITDFHERWPIGEIGVDPWQSGSIMGELNAVEIKCIKTTQRFSDLSNATKRLLELVLEGKIALAGDPVLDWMATNTICRYGPEGGMKPDKENAEAKIDGISALCMALARALLHPVTQLTEREVFNEWIRNA